MDVTTRLAALGNGAVGCWLLVASVLFDAPAIARWNNVAVGTAIALAAGYNYSRAARRRPVSVAGAAIVGALGLWLVVAPFVLGFEGAAMWSDVLSGTVVASFAGYNAYAAVLADAAPGPRAMAERGRR